MFAYFKVFFFCMCFLSSNSHLSDHNGEWNLNNIFETVQEINVIGGRGGMERIVAICSTVVTGRTVPIMSTATLLWVLTSISSALTNLVSFILWRHCKNRYCGRLFVSDELPVSCYFPQSLLPFVNRLLRFVFILF